MEWITLTDAASRLLSECKLSNRNYAQRVLIATFIEELATPVCDSYWITLSLDEAVELKPPFDRGVPSDFWTLGHAIEASANDGYITSGPRCHWGATSNFFKDVTRSGYVAREMLRDCDHHLSLGVQPVRIEFSAMDVRIASVDLEAIISRKKFAPLLRRVQNRPSIQTGNLKKSDIERLWARVCCNFLNVADRLEIASDPERLLESVRLVAETVSEEATISDRSMKRIADLVCREAGRSLSEPPH